MANKAYWLKKRIEIAEKAVARYKACELTLLERALVLDAKILENTWQKSLDSLKSELKSMRQNKKL